MSGETVDVIVADMERTVRELRDVIQQRIADGERSRELGKMQTMTGLLADYAKRLRKAQK